MQVARINASNQSEESAVFLPNPLVLVNQQTQSIFLL
jgi:hypothetical protein